MECVDPDFEGVTFKPFTQETLVDAKKIVAEVFRDEACALLDMMVQNHNIKEFGWKNIGDIVYRNDIPVGFQSTIPWKIYIGNSVYQTAIGSTMCLRRSETPVLTLELENRSMEKRGESKLFFGNTSCRAAMRLAKAVAGENCVVGPDTFSRKHWYRVSYFNYIRYRLQHVLSVLVRRIFKKEVNLLMTWEVRDKGFEFKAGEFIIRRELSVEHKKVEDFWQRYIAGNKGIVSSRGARDVEWVFGDGIRIGKVVMLGIYKEGALNGWIVLQHSCNGSRWNVLDWVALDNSERILETLIVGAKHYLKSKTPAWYFQIHGYPKEIEPLIRVQFPNEIKLSKYDAFVYVHLGDDLKESMKKIEYPESWFFGVYDGDAAWQWQCE